MWVGRGGSLNEHQPYAAEGLFYQDVGPVTTYSRWDLDMLPRHNRLTTSVACITWTGVRHRLCLQPDAYCRLYSTHVAEPKEQMELSERGLIPAVRHSCDRLGVVTCTVQACSP